MDAPHRPKLAETFVHEAVRLREAAIGRRCEVLANTRIEYASLGDYSYLGENCEVADAAIGKFTAIANSVRIGAPNHPMGRPSQHRFTSCPVNPKLRINSIFRSDSVVAPANAVVSERKSVEEATVFVGFGDDA